MYADIVAIDSESCVRGCVLFQICRQDLEEERACPLLEMVGVIES